MASGTEPQPYVHTYLLLGQVNTKSDLHNALKTKLDNQPAGQQIKVYFMTGDTGLDSTIFTRYGNYFGTAVKPVSSQYTAIFTNQVGGIISIGYYSTSGGDIVTGWSSKKGESF